MTFTELRRNIETTSGGKYFFDRDTLKFFGERLSEMRLLKGTAEVTDIHGEKHTCYVISSTRRKNHMGACSPYPYYHYFDVNTFKRVIR